MKELTRTKINDFSIDQSIQIEELKNKQDLLMKKIISIEDFFEKNPKIDLNDKSKELFVNGVLLTYNLPDGIYRIYQKNIFIGIGIIKNCLLKRDIVL